MGQHKYEHKWVTRKMKKINKNMMIGEAVNSNPRVAEVLLDSGVHCIGCGGMSFETIEQGLKAHGMSGKEIDKLITEINEQKLVRITKNAEIQMKKMLGKKYSYLRLEKSGEKWKLILEKNKNKEDSIVKECNINIIFKKDYKSKIKNIAIDYADDLGGFIVR